MSCNQAFLWYLPPPASRLVPFDGVMKDAAPQECILAQTYCVNIPLPLAASRDVLETSSQPLISCT